MQSRCQTRERLLAPERDNPFASRSPERTEKRGLTRTRERPEAAAAIPHG